MPCAAFRPSKSAGQVLVDLVAGYVGQNRDRELSQFFVGVQGSFEQNGHAVSSAQSAQSMRVDQAHIGFTPQRRNQIEGHEIAAHGCPLLFLERRQAPDGDARTEAFHGAAGVGQRID